MAIMPRVEVMFVQSQTPEHTIAQCESRSKQGWTSCSMGIAIFCEEEGDCQLPFRLLWVELGRPSSW